MAMLTPDPNEPNNLQVMTSNTRSPSGRNVHYLFVNAFYDGNNNRIRDNGEIPRKIKICKIRYITDEKSYKGELEQLAKRIKEKGLFGISPTPWGDDINVISIGPDGSIIAPVESVFFYTDESEIRKYIQLREKVERLQDKYRNLRTSSKQKRKILQEQLREARRELREYENELIMRETEIHDLENQQTNELEQIENACQDEIADLRARFRNYRKANPAQPNYDALWRRLERSSDVNDTADSVTRMAYRMEVERSNLDRRAETLRDNDKSLRQWTGTWADKQLRQMKAKQESVPKTRPQTPQKRPARQR